MSVNEFEEEGEITLESSIQSGITGKGKEG